MKAAIFCIVMWFVMNISTLILNKYIFTSLQFTYPLSLTAVHMATCFAGAILTLRVFKLIPFISINWNDCFQKILPLATLFCANIVLGNVSLRWVPVSFMQTIKSSVPAFTVLLQVLFFKKSFSWDTYLALVPVVGGVGIASWAEVNFVKVGFYAALVASVITALMAIVSGVLLTQQLDAVNLTYYLAPFSFVMLLPFAIYVEFPLIRTEWEYYGNYEPVLILVISGAIAFLLNIFTFYVIKYTSPLTYTVAGNCKVVLSVTISVLIFKNEVTILNGIGCAVALIGVMWYNHIRYQANKQTGPPKSPNATKLKADPDESPLLKDSSDASVEVKSEK